MIQYIASDVDGTLLHGHATTLNPELFDIIRQLKEHGIHFIAASGRQYKNLQRLFAPVKDDISYVAENGSMCVHDGKIVSLGHIDTDLIYEIADAAKEYGHCHTLISTARTGYTDSKDSDYIDHIRNNVGYDMDVVQNVRDIKEPFIKIAVCDFDGTEKRLRAYFQERFGNRIKIVTSGNIWIDFIAPNANKGSALSNIVSSLGMAPKNGITFGDQYNDLEMLQLSNISYAMTTAATGVADYATHTTDSVEKTLWEFLQTL